MVPCFEFESVTAVILYSSKIRSAATKVFYDNTNRIIMFLRDPTRCLSVKLWQSKLFLIDSVYNNLKTFTLLYVPTCLFSTQHHHLPNLLKNVGVGFHSSFFIPEAPVSFIYSRLSISIFTKAYIHWLFSPVPHSQPHLPALRSGRDVSTRRSLVLEWPE